MNDPPGSATLVRSPDGMAIGGVIINRPILTQFLRRLCGQTSESVEKLLDPSDHQNVPQAVKLMQALSSLKDMDASSFSPSDLDSHRALKALGELWISYLNPFIVPDLSLTRQLEALSKFGHMTFVLYLKHGSSFMANQLYADMQALVKCAYFCVAQQQLLDPSMPWYMFLLGDDRLEEMFGEVRTVTHDRNCDPIQLTERLAGAADTAAIYNRHPTWKRASRRISYSGSEGSDHVNPKYFTGDLIVSNVDLKNVWESGKIQAIEVLSRAGIHCDINMALSPIDVDFLRPHTGGKYPGIAGEKDRSQPDEAAAVISTFVSESESGAACASLPTSDLQGSLSNAEPSTLGSAPALFEDAETDQPEVDQEVDELRFMPDMNDLLAVDHDGNVTTSDTTPSDWLEFQDTDGKMVKIHKVSLCGRIFDSPLAYQTTVRNLRVRTYTGNVEKISLNTDDTALTGEHLFKSPDLGAGLVRTNDILAVAIFRTLSLEKKGIKVPEVEEAELGTLAASDIRITGQVLDLEYVANSEVSPVWGWTSMLARFDPLRDTAQTTEDGTHKLLVVQFSGNLVEPINPSLVDTSTLSLESQARFHDRGGYKHSYTVSESQFNHVIETLFESQDPAELLARLPKHGKSSSVPYRTQDGTVKFIVEGATRLLHANKANADKVACYQCNTVVSHVGSRNHVGEHILKALHDVVESDLLEQVSQSPSVALE